MNFKVLLNLGPTSTQLISVSIEFFVTPSTLLEPKYHMWLGNFPKFRWKNSKLPVFTENWLEVLIPNPHLDFWNLDPKIHFWANLDLKSGSCPFCLKIGAHSISGMIILIPTLVFWICNLKSIFGQVWAKKVKVVCFASK